MEDSTETGSGAQVKSLKAAKQSAIARWKLELTMSAIDKLLSIIGIRKMKFTLIGHEREGGYIYITSPDLPGFTFMLEPGENRDIRTFIDAINDPLMAYMSEYFKAMDNADHIQMAGIRRSKPMNYVAELAYV